MAIQFDTFMKSVRRIAINGALGGLGALQALELGIFKFPPNVQLYLSYFFSIFSVICIFFGGGLSVILISSKISDIYKKIKDLDDKEENKP